MKASIFSPIFKNKMSLTSSNLIYNRIVLYILVFIAVVNVISNALVGDYIIPTLFFLIGFITSFFNKNMVVILAIAISFSNIIKYTTKVNVSEGLENSPKDTPIADETTETDEKKTDGKTESSNPSFSTGASLLKKRLSEPQPAPENSKVNQYSIKEARSNLQELTKLHSTITENMDIMEKTLKKAENVFDKVTEGLQNMRKGNI